MAGSVNQRGRAGFGTPASWPLGPPWRAEERRREEELGRSDTEGSGRCECEGQPYGGPASPPQSRCSHQAAWAGGSLPFCLCPSPEGRGGGVGRGERTRTKPHLSVWLLPLRPISQCLRMVPLPLNPGLSEELGRVI